MAFNLYPVKLGIQMAMNNMKKIINVRSGNYPMNKLLEFISLPCKEMTRS